MPIKKLRLTENSTMVLGNKYKGKPLSDVPAHHLLWWWENTDIQDKMRLGLYIEENMERLMAEEALKNKKYNR